MDAHTARQQYAEADRLYRAAQYDQALTVLSQLNQAFPGEKNVMYPAARCMYTLGLVEEAAAMCRQLIDQFDHRQARRLLARIEAGGASANVAHAPRPESARALAAELHERAHGNPIEVLDILCGIVQDAMRPGVAVDPGQFGDPQAARTEWGPMTTDFGLYKTHDLVKEGAGRLAFKARTLSKSASCCLFVVVMFFLLVIVAPLCLILIMLLFGLSDLFSDFPLLARLVRNWGLLLVLGPIIVLLATAAGVYLYRRFEIRTPIVFDKSVGYYWKGRGAAYKPRAFAERNNACKLSDIHALQLIYKIYRRGGASIYLYELNLVLTNGARLNVLSHGDRESLWADAEILAAFLNRPIWDAM